MIEYKRLRIDITDIRKNGVVCDDPVITWVTQQGVIYPCIGEDYIEVEVLPNQSGYVEFFVQCSDCEDCPPLHVKRGLCDTAADCEDCEKCEGGWCVPICPDQLCVNNTCVDCGDDTDCPTNKECLNGECVCPADKPFVDERGYCVSCLTSDNCGNCAECQNGECVAKDCGDGVCDPNTDQCVECNKSGDCSGPNECCVDNKCECCPGYIWDYSANQCIEQPPCTFDSDCGTCEVCEDGNCVPLDCPVGYTCIEGDCVKICDCVGGSCPQGQTCVPYGDVCICVSCTGDCVDDNDCDTGCLCGGANKCIPDPCQGSCDNAADCGPGCGCLNGECVPCSSIDCSSNPSDCADIVGCRCQGDNCRKLSDGCTGTCITGYDCGEDCTCYNGECVPCSWFDCGDGSCDERPECQCVSGNCEGDPDYRDCADSFDFVKSNCDLSLELSGVSTCPCPKISAGLKFESIGTAANGQIPVVMGVQLRKGEAYSSSAFLSLPKLSDNHPDIAENEEPTSGSLTLEIRTTYIPMKWSNGVLIIDTAASEVVVTTTAPFVFSGTDYEQDTVNLPQIGYIDEENERKAKSVTTVLKQSSKFVFPNGCEYITPATLNSYTYKGSAPLTTTTIVGTITSDDTRAPIFTVYKSEDSSPSTGDIFRKAYATKSGAKYIDTYYGLDEIPGSGIIASGSEEGELWGNRYYYATNDCGCTNATSIGKLVFCDDDEFTFDITECNTKFEFTGSYLPCDVNQEITGRGYPIPSNVQTKYELYINGVYVARMVWDGTKLIFDNVADSTYSSYVGTGVFVGTKAFTFTSPIEEVKVKINYDDADECTQIYNNSSNVDDLDTLYYVECIEGTKYEVLVPTAGQPGTITSVKIGSTTGTVGNYYSSTVGGNVQAWKVLATKGADTVVTVTYAGGCVTTFTVNECSCGAFDFASLNATDAGCGGEVTFAPTFVNGQPPYSYTYDYNVKAGYTERQDGIIDANSYENDTVVTVSVVDSAGCTAETTYTLSAPDYTLDYVDELNLCYGNSGALVFTCSNGHQLFLSTNIPAINTTPMFTGGVAIVPIPPSTAAGSYYVTVDSIRIDGASGCVVNVNDTIPVEVAASLSASVALSFPPVGNLCSADGVYPDFVITAPPNTTAYYNYSTTAPDCPLVSSYVAIGPGGIAVVPHRDCMPVPTIITHTLTLTGVAGAACSVDVTGATASFDVYKSPAVTIDESTVACEDANNYTFEFENLDPAASLAVDNGFLNTGGSGSNTHTVTGATKGIATKITSTGVYCTTETYSIAYNCGCSGFIVPPPVTTTPDQTYCEGAGVPAFTATADPGLTILWYDSTYSYRHTGTSYTPTPPASNDVTEVYYARAQDADNCTSEYVTFTITRNTNPDVTLDYANGYTSICANTGGVYKATVVTSSPTAGTFADWWDDGRVEWITIPSGYVVSSANNGTVTLGNFPAGVDTAFTLRCNYEDDNGCTGSTITNLTAVALETADTQALTPASDTSFGNLGTYMSSGAIANGDSPLSVSESGAGTVTVTDANTGFYLNGGPLSSPTYSRSFDFGDVDAGTNRITVSGGHDFGVAGQTVALHYTEGTGAITGLSDDTIYLFDVVDSTTLELNDAGENITAAGAGTGHLLKPPVGWSFGNTGRARQSTVFHSVGNVTSQAKSYKVTYTVTGPSGVYSVGFGMKPYGKLSIHGGTYTNQPLIDLSDANVSSGDNVPYARWWVAEVNLVNGVEYCFTIEYSGSDWNTTSFELYDEPVDTLKGLTTESAIEATLIAASYEGLLTCTSEGLTCTSGGLVTFDGCDAECDCV